ncbi:MAG: hypothetical protein HQ465_17405 [Rhodospirillales bacterium]|nr:hypothetical protein [Rhodospirillales bacterium]
MSGMSTAAIISLGLSAAGTAAGLAGQLQQQQAQQQAAAADAARAVYQAQVARQNQNLTARQADEALQRGQVAEENSRRETRQRIGAQAARLAAQGTDIEGSPADILGDTAAAGAVDALTLRANAARAAYGYQVAGVGYGSVGVLETTRALNPIESPNYLGAGASLLSGASTLAERWRNFQLNNGSGR